MRHPRKPYSIHVIRMTAQSLKPSYILFGAIGPKRNVRLRWVELIQNRNLPVPHYLKRYDDSKDSRWKIELYDRYETLKDAQAARSALRECNEHLFIEDCRTEVMR